MFKRNKSKPTTPSTPAPTPNFKKYTRFADYSIGEKVIIDIDAYIKKSEPLFESKKIGSNQTMDFYYIDGRDLIGKDIATQECTYLGSIHLPAAVYHNSVYWFKDSSIYSEKYIMRKEIGTNYDEVLDILSNEWGAFVGGHMTSEDTVEDISVKDDAVYALVRRRVKDGGEYHLIITEDEDEINIKKAVVSGKMARLNLTGLSEIFEKHYYKIFHIYQSGKRVTCAQLSPLQALPVILSAMYAVARYTLELKKEDAETLETIYNEVIKSRIRTVDLHKDFSIQVDGFWEVICGKKPRAECIFANDEAELSQNAVAKAVIKLGDCFVNPDCVTNYDGASRVVMTSNETSNFIMYVYRPIFQEMTSMVMEILAYEEKEPERPVWRNETGAIDCPGDSCPKDCDDTCPIWCNTIGLEQLSDGQTDKAEKSFAKAISIEPEFPDAHNNLGSVYGMTGRDQLAYDEFSKALELKPDYFQALRGLIIAEKNLGKFDDALKHCDQLDSIKKGSAEELRTDILKRRDKKPSDNWTGILTKLLETGRSRGYIKSDGIPFIPELLMMADDTNVSIIQDMMDYGNTHPKTDVVSMALIWSAYAGIGAVYHWNKNWNELQATGLFEILTRERGISEMDEYVLDCINMPFGSAKQKEFTQFLYSQSLLSLSLLTPDEEEDPLALLMCAAKAMFVFGMAFEMNRLGMM